MVDRAAVIAAEQRAVDYAYTCHERRFRENREKLKPNRTTDSHAGTAFIPEAAPEVPHEDDLGGEALVVARVDVVEDDAERTWYIGRRLVRDADFEPVVINWQSPQAKEWLLRPPNQAGEVTLRRRLRCDGRTVRDYQDEIGTEPVKPERLRDFLLEDLERARDGTMRDIVETIQREQLLLVSDTPRGVMVVQGGPGTGKTAVGLHRISWLLYNRHFRTQDVLVVGPHRRFLTYVRDVLPRLGTRGVVPVETSRLWDKPRGSDPLPARAVKAGARMAAVLERAVRNLGGARALARIARDGSFGFDFEGSVISLPRTELESLLNAEDAPGPYLARRRSFGTQVVNRLAKAAAEARPGRPDPRIRARIERHPQVVRLMNVLWPNMSPEAVLRRLLDDPDTLRAAADGVLTDEEQRAIHRPQAARMADEPWSLEDLVCLEELRFLISGEGPQRYRHIVVDEAQDLTPMQARALARRCPSGSMTILGDLAQTTGVHRYADWAELAGLLSGEDGWHLEELTIGYRVPREVMEFAQPLGAAVSSDTAAPRSIRPGGDGVLRIAATDHAERVADAVARAFDIIGKEADPRRSVTLIVPDALTEQVRQAVSAVGGKRLPLVIAAPDAKGLEFDHVVVVEPAMIAQQEPSGLGQLYVAITRCTQSLTIVHADPIPHELIPSTAAPEQSAAPEGSAAPEEAAAAPEEVEEDTVTSAPAADAADQAAADHTAGFQPFISALEQSVREERRCHVHEEIRFSLLAELHRARLTPVSHSPTADILCEGPAGTVLYEVLGEGETSYARLREAVLRIMEVQYAEGRPADQRFLVLPDAPADPWVVDVLSEAFDVSVIWRTADGWDGQRVDVALGGPGKD